MPRGHRKGHGRRPKGGADQESTGRGRVWTVAELHEWFAAKVHDDWFEGAPSVLADREEIQVTGVIPVPEGEYVTDADKETACAGAIAEFREATRDARVDIAAVAEATWDRKVSWGVQCGPRHDLFTHLNIPVMTRLRIEDRQVLDTLVAANVARSRSDALGWCVRRIADDEADWLDRLRAALTEVERVRSDGPAAGSVQDAPVEDPPDDAPTEDPPVET